MRVNTVSSRAGGESDRCSPWRGYLLGGFKYVAETQRFHFLCFCFFWYCFYSVYGIQNLKCWFWKILSHTFLEFSPWFFWGDSIQVGVNIVFFWMNCDTAVIKILVGCFMKGMKYYPTMFRDYFMTFMIVYDVFGSLPINKSGFYGSCHVRHVCFRCSKWVETTNYLEDHPSL